MVVLESVSELHLEPISLPEAPQETQSAPASFKSLGLLSIHLDAGHLRAPRRSSEGDHPENVSVLPNVPPTMDSNAKPLSSAVLLEATAEDDEVTTLGPPRNTSGSIVDADTGSVKELYRYTSFPPSISTDNLFRTSEKESPVTAEVPKVTSSQATGQHLALPLQSADSLERALGTISEHSNETDAMSNMQELLPIPETPLGISQLQFGSVVSFNTSVQDLIQETSDTPIGGPATPLGHPSPVTLPKNPLASLTNSPKKPSLLSRYLKPQNTKSSSIKSNSEASEMMATAPEMLVNRRARVATDLSYDGPAGDLPHTGTDHIGTDARDFAFNPAQSSTLHECCVSPRSSIPNDIPGFFESNALKTTAISALDGFFSEKKHPESKIPPPASKESAKNSKGTKGELPDLQDTATNGVGGQNVWPNHEHALKGKENEHKKEHHHKKKEHHHKKKDHHHKKEDNHTQEGGPDKKEPDHKKKDLAKEKSSHGLMPVDNTNQVSIPETPLSTRNGQPKAPLHRRIRGVVLVTPVLAIVIGRKLAKPTRSVLKQAAKATSAAGGPIVGSPIPA